jgi:hypothetical protein
MHCVDWQSLDLWNFWKCAGFIANLLISRSLYSCNVICVDDDSLEQVSMIQAECLLVSQSEQWGTFRGQGWNPRC